MGLKRSISKRAKRTLEKIKHRYFEGLRRGKSESYYFHPSFYRYYLKRFAWLLVSLLILDKKPYKTFYKIVSADYFTYRSGNGVSRNNIFKVLLRTLFGFNFLKVKSLYPAYSAQVIHASKKLVFNKPSEPLVSIIIPAYNNLSYTYNCLLSIQDNVSDTVRYEIIVIDDCSTDETQSFFKNNVEGVKYIRNAENLGYLKSNNKAADIAEGKYLCLLNNRTEVQKNWLEPLLILIENNKKTGCVGSMLIYPNNLLKEAGGVVSNIGFSSSFGRMEDPSQLAYNFIREVDYCSAASILLRKSDFEKIGKFDGQFSDGHHEEIDLSFSIRNILNKQVVYNPSSKAIYFPETTSYDADNELKKDYRTESYSKFLKKWNRFLTDHDPEGFKKSYRRLLPTSTIMVIGWSLPEFDLDFESMRLFRLLKIFKSLNLHVVYIPEDGRLKDPYYTALIDSGIEVRLDFNSHYSVNDFEAIEYFASVEYIWISQTDLNILYRDKIKIFKNAKWIYDPVGFNHLETNLAKEADLTIAINEVEKRTLDRYGIKKSCVVPSIHDLRSLDKLKPFSERSGLIFVGDYRYIPNIDACIWLVKEIMPIVWKTMPSVRLYLLGDNPPEEISQLINQKVILENHKQDLKKYLLESKMLLAPLRYQINVKTDIGQALEFQLPFISTTMGVEGTELRANKNFLLAENAEEFADHILRLYHDPDLWTTLSGKSEVAIDYFCSKRIKETLQNSFQETGTTVVPNEYFMEVEV